MKYCFALSVLLLLSCAQRTDNAASEDKVEIDALVSSPDNFRLLMENDHVRVLEYTLKPGATDRPHTHPPKSAYIVSGGKVKVYLDNGDTHVDTEEAGTSYWSDYVGKHYVENIDTVEVKVILTEIKDVLKK